MRGQLAEPTDEEEEVLAGRPAVELGIVVEMDAVEGRVEAEDRVAKDDLQPNFLAVVSHSDETDALVGDVGGVFAGIEEPDAFLAKLDAGEGLGIGKSGQVALGDEVHADILAGQRCCNVLRFILRQVAGKDSKGIIRNEDGVRRGE
jgi:hypothetical protein